MDMKWYPSHYSGGGDRKKKDGLFAAFAQALTSLAGNEDGKSVMSAFACLCDAGGKEEQPLQSNRA